MMAHWKPALAGIGVVTGVVLIAGLSVTSAVGRAASGPPHAAPVPVLVELFTSEGCSSCPPADRVLIDLLRTQPVQGARVIGLSEHVDYWNQLGWKDPFSDALFSRRQSAYAAAARSSEVYTPQMIVDGGAAFVGSDRAAALAAIARAAAAPKAALSLTWTSTAPPTLSVTLTGGAPAAGATVFLAIVEDGLSSSVRAGENSGHVLPHGAVTRRLVEIGTADRAGTFTQADLRITLDAAWHASALHVVAFAQAGPRRILAAGSIDVAAR